MSKNAIIWAISQDRRQMDSSINQYSFKLFECLLCARFYTKFLFKTLCKINVKTRAVTEIQVPKSILQLHAT